MYISVPLDAVQPFQPIVPDEPMGPPTPTSSAQPPDDPNAPKYSVPGVIITSTIFGTLILIAVLVVLWKRRAKLIACSWPLPKWMRQCITPTERFSFPMPASAYLCGWIRVPSPESTPSNTSPPPPYDSQPGALGPPVLPPGLQPYRRENASTSTLPGPSPSPPPTYPPAPPPTPDGEPAAAVAAALPVAAPPVAAPPVVAPPIVIVTPPDVAPSVFAPPAPNTSRAASRARTQALLTAPAAPGRSTPRSTRSAHLALVRAPLPPPVYSPPPTYPPPPCPETRRMADRGQDPYVDEACAVPWGSVEACTPRTSSVLALCGYEG